MNTCNFTKAPLRDYYADLWRNIAEAILGCVFSHWGLKVCKPKIISDLFTVIAFIFWTLLTLFLSLVCIQNPLCSPCPWAKSQCQNTYECCQVTPNNILAATIPAICSNPAAAELYCRHRDVWTQPRGQNHSAGETDTNTQPHGEQNFTPLL